MSTTISPPYNVVYYNDNTDPVTGAAEQCFNVVIYAFLLWNSPSDVYLDAPLTASVLADIPTLQSEGITVLLSIGGSTITCSQWCGLVDNTDTFAASVQAVVEEYGFDGVDIDYEDTANLSSESSGGSADCDASNCAYDGVQLLIDLTNSLSSALGDDAIITHAPQPPYLCSPNEPTLCSVQPSPYITILDAVGSKITWLNMQWYNNSWYEGADSIVQQYQNIVSGWTYTDADGNEQTFSGMSPSQLVAGFPTAEGMADTGGYIDADDLVSEIIQPLQGLYDDFGGIMGWEFSGADADWGTTIGAALGTCSDDDSNTQTDAKSRLSRPGRRFRR